MLADRLTELREAGIVERADDGYRLSARGTELAEVVLLDGQVGGGLAAAGAARGPACRTPGQVPAAASS